MDVSPGPWRPVRICLIAFIVAVCTAVAQPGVAGEDITEIEGILNTIWDGRGPERDAQLGRRPLYRLVDDQGVFHCLELYDQDGTLKRPVKELGGPHRLNRKRLRVTGRIEPQSQCVDVQSIDLLESPD